MDSAKNKRLQDSRAIQNMSTKLPIEDLSRKGKKEEKQQDRVRKTEHKWSIWRCYADGFEDGENGYEKMHADSL